MIESASLIGFLLLFFAASVLSSLVLCIAVMAFRRVLRALGSGAERQAAFLALTLPPVLASGLSMVLAGRSFVRPPFGFPDHCHLHPYHLHLCLRHGGAWAEHAPETAGLLAVLTYVALRIAHRLFKLVRGSRALDRLVAVAEPLACAPDVMLADTRRAFSFAAGILRSRIVLSSGAWERLEASERLAVIEHERAHVEQRDLLARLLLDFAALFGSPFLGARVLALWDRATERLCDRRAAVRIGDPAAVASALVKMARASNRERELVFAPFSSPNVVERVEALLAGEAEGQHARARLTRIAGLSLLAALALIVVLADPIHHALEHILGAH